MGWGEVALQTAAILGPVIGAAWQVYSGRRSTHASEIAQIESSISSAATRDPVLAKAYRAHALKRLSDFHGRPGNAGMATLLWVTVAIGIFALIPGATGWPALLLMATFALSLMLAGSNYSKFEYRHQVRDHETSAALEKALIHAREELIDQVEESAPTERRTSLAQDAGNAIKSWSRQRKILVASLTMLLFASIGAGNWLAEALQQRRLEFDQTLAWTAWMLSVGLVVFVAATPLVSRLLAHVAEGRMLRLLRYLVPITIAAATFTWIPPMLAQYLRQMILEDPNSTWTSVASMIVFFHAFALVALFGPAAVQVVNRVRCRIKNATAPTAEPSGVHP